jgi:hypothetical protein
MRSVRNGTRWSAIVIGGESWVPDSEGEAEVEELSFSPPKSASNTSWTQRSVSGGERRYGSKCHEESNARKRERVRGVAVRMLGNGRAGTGGGGGGEKALCTVESVGLDCRR